MDCYFIFHCVLFTFTLARIENKLDLLGNKTDALLLILEDEKDVVVDNRCWF